MKKTIKNIDIILSAIHNTMNDTVEEMGENPITHVLGEQVLNLLHQVDTVFSNSQRTLLKYQYDKYLPQPVANPSEEQKPTEEKPTEEQQANVPEKEQEANAVVDDAQIAKKTTKKPAKKKTK